MPFWQFFREGRDGHALLVQPSIFAHRKWPKMVVSASTNQVWTKITTRSFAWAFSIQIQIQAVWIMAKSTSGWKWRCLWNATCYHGRSHWAMWFKSSWWLLYFLKHRRIQFQLYSWRSEPYWERNFSGCWKGLCYIQ